MTSALVDEEVVPDMSVPDGAEVASEENTPREDALSPSEGGDGQVQVEETSASPVLEENELVVEEEPIEQAEQAPLPSLARDAEDRIVQKSTEEAERKRELIQKGQKELEEAMKELSEQRMKRRQAAAEESQRREQENNSLSGCAPGVERTRGETWSVVCELIDFKRDTKADLSKYKSLIIQLKHSSS